MRAFRLVDAFQLSSGLSVHRTRILCHMGHHGPANLDQSGTGRLAKGESVVQNGNRIPRREWVQRSPFWRFGFWRTKS